MTYAQNNTPREPRLPISFRSEEDIASRLTATYTLEVESREHSLILDVPTSSKIKKVAHWLYSGTKRGLILMGTCGNGKSTMLRAIKRLFEARASYCHAEEVYEFCRKSQGDICHKDDKLLIIDDLGAEPTTCQIYGNDTDPLERLLCYRYNIMRTTIIATNLGTDQIRKRYGDRLADRIKEQYNVLMYKELSYRGNMSENQKR